MSTFKNNSAESTASGRLKVNSSDLLGYLADKLSGDDTIDVTAKTNSDGSYYLELAVNASVVGTDNYTVKLTSGDASPDYLIAKIDEVFAASLILQDYLSAGAGINLSINGSGVITITVDANLTELADVNIPSPATDGLMTYNATSGFWQLDFAVRKDGAVSWVSEGIVPTANAIDNHITDDNHTITGDWDFTGATSFDNITGEKTNVTVVSAAIYDVLVTDNVLLVDTVGGNPTIVLPAVASNAGRILKIKKYNQLDSSSHVKIIPNLTETIDEKSEFVLNGLFHHVTLSCDGTNWYVVGESKRYFQEAISVSGGAATLGNGTDFVKLTTGSAAANNELKLPGQQFLNGGERITIKRISGTDSIVLDDYDGTAPAETINGAAAPYTAASGTDVVIVEFDKENADWTIIEI